jgi:hypothetical protein
MLCVALIVSDPSWWTTWLIVVVAAVAVWNQRSFRASRVEVLRQSFEVRVVSNPRGVTVQRPGSTARHEWYAFQEIVATDAHVFFRLTAASGFMIPTPSFRDADQRNQFLAITQAARLGG